MLNRAGKPKMGKTGKTPFQVNRTGAVWMRTVLIFLGLAAVSMAPDAKICFENIVVPSGISFVLDNSATPQKHQIETMIAGVAVFDYNNDGLLDIYFVNGAAVPGLDKSNPRYYNRLYRNNGDETFTDVTDSAGLRGAGYGMGVAAGDYDNDGYEDVFVAGVNRNQLFHNNGDGTFTDVSRKAGVDDPNGYYGLGVLWADFNNAGRPDLYAANDSEAGFLYRNDGNGKLTEIGMESGAALGEDGHEQAGMGVAAGDYLHTGRPSLAVTTFALDNTPLYRNDGNWNFDEVSYAAGVGLPSLPWVKWGIAFVDLDNDGWLDLVTATGHVYPQADQLPSSAKYREPKLVQYNQGDGTFCDASDQSGPAILEPRVSRGLAVGDLFNDGNMDLVVEDLVGKPMVLRNHAIPGRHWISFELAGQKSNRMAIGARLKLVAGGTTQTEEIRSGGSYLSQSDTRVHFGLGKVNTIDSLQIRWPSGKVDTFHDLAADKFYSVLEGQGIVPAESIRPRKASTARPQKSR